MNRSPPPPADQTLRLALAQKLLHAWSQNRLQVRVPLSLNLARMPAAQRVPVARLMAAALAACGATAEADAARLDQALERIGGAAERAPARRALHDPPDLIALLGALEAAGLSAHGYAAAALVLERRVPAQRLFLNWLAARFALPATLTAGLARR
ncbi:hypothetical protein DFH01_17635 [Falsiroseomonas bella]|uniref:DUF533 domain-containing protein n=1 Tax=Falsiroseomonas bella TaxID=2184016 RepID=A0A317FBQ5_9PROT|nr:DUF533 domain-containing protein [Falsiroseomonas bella]PWS35437.1 hypothetical protein DFH01_17635 [Falsiroseomonas bella]